MIHCRLSGALLLAVTLVTSTSALAQQPPRESHGMHASTPTVVDLGAEMDNVEGRQLRLRVLTIDAGGAVALHSHKGRPAVVYLLEGTLTEHIEGGETTDHHAGDTWTEAKSIVHWAENKGSVPARLVAVDVFKP